MNTVTSPAKAASGEPPRRSWLFTWAVALLLFAVILAGAETGWRMLGYCSGAVDSPALWKYWYERGVASGPRAIAIIGSSRIQAGIATSTARHELPEFEIVQLAKYASGSPVAVLRVLAADERFHGIVFFDMIEPFLFRRYWEEQSTVPDSTAGPIERFEALEASVVRDYLAVRTQETGIKTAFKEFVIHGFPPVPLHIRMRADRSLEFNYDGLKNLEEFRKRTLQSIRSEYEASQLPTVEEFDRDIEVIEQYVSAIRSRGGEVVFVRMPTSGGRLELENKYHPKDKYWDRFAASTKGICIHPADVPGMREFKCPDDSHLDYRDAVTFTQVLIDELRRRDVLGDARILP